MPSKSFSGLIPYLEAYFLGIVSTTGKVHLKKVPTLTIRHTDEAVLTYLSREMGSPRSKVTPIPNSRFHELSLSGKHVASYFDLRSRRALRAGRIFLVKQINPSFESHFVRGCFELCGSLISRQKVEWGSLSSSLSLRFEARSALLKVIEDMVHSHLGIRGQQALGGLSYVASEDAANIVSWLFQSGTHYSVTIRKHSLDLVNTHIGKGVCRVGLSAGSKSRSSSLALVRPSQQFLPRVF